jgi:hypothetical protein
VNDKSDNPHPYSHWINIELYYGNQTTEGNNYLAQEIFNKTKASHQNGLYKTYSETSHQWYGCLKSDNATDFNECKQRVVLILHSPANAESESEFQNASLSESCFKILNGVTIPCVLFSGDTPADWFNTKDSHNTTEGTVSASNTSEKQAPPELFHISNPADIRYDTYNSTRGYTIQYPANYSNNTPVPIPFVPISTDTWSSELDQSLSWRGEKTVKNVSSVYPPLVNFGISTGLMWPHKSLDSLMMSLVSYELKEDQIHNMSHVQGGYTTIAGNPAYKVIFTGDRNIGPSCVKVPYKVMEIITVKNGTYYQFTYYTTSENYDYYLPIIQHMIDSFKITYATTPPLPPQSAS